jgi:hypothetical protein
MHEHYPFKGMEYTQLQCGKINVMQGWDSDDELEWDFVLQTWNVIQLILGCAVTKKKQL